MPFPTKTLLTQGEKLTSGSSFETASVEMTANSLILFFVAHGHGANPAISSVTSGDEALEFDVIVDEYSADHGKRMIVARAMPTSTKTDTLKVILADAVTWGNWGVVQVENVAQGNNGADAIVQTAINTVIGNTQMTTTFSSAFASADNAAVAFGVMGNGDLSWSSPFTSIHAQQTDTEAWNRVWGSSAWYDGDADPTMQMGYNSGTLWAAELSYSEGGEPPPVTGKAISTTYNDFPIAKLRG